MAPQLPKTFKAVVVESAGAPLTVKDVELKRPGPGQVLVKVLACGVCHTDDAIAKGHMGNVFPRTPGHEIVGDVVEVGQGVDKWSTGDRVGGAWHGGQDDTCLSCRRGKFQCCENVKVTGLSHDGGYAEYVLLDAATTVRVPSNIDPAEAAPLLCAGVTVFNGMRKMQIEHGNLVAIQGIGGLGHLAVQYASKMGYRVAVISSSPDKADFAKKLGAHEFIATSQDDPVKKLQELGGAALIVATAPNPKAIGPLIDGLQAGGKLLVLAPAGPVEFNTVSMIMKGSSVHGWPSGHALDSEEAIAFASTHGVKCMIEKFPLAEVQAATQHMLDGKVRFRGVLIP